MQTCLNRSEDSIFRLVSFIFLINNPDAYYVMWANRMIRRQVDLRFVKIIIQERAY